MANIKTLSDKTIITKIDDVDNIIKEMIHVQANSQLLKINYGQKDIILDLHLVIRTGDDTPLEIVDTNDTNNNYHFDKDEMRIIINSVSVTMNENDFEEFTKFFKDALIDLRKERFPNLNLVPYKKSEFEKIFDNLGDFKIKSKFSEGFDFICKTTFDEVKDIGNNPKYRREVDTEGKAAAADYKKFRKSMVKMVDKSLIADLAIKGAAMAGIGPYLAPFLISLGLGAGFVTLAGTVINTADNAMDIKQILKRVTTAFYDNFKKYNKSIYLFYLAKADDTTSIYRKHNYAINVDMLKNFIVDINITDDHNIIPKPTNFNGMLKYTPEMKIMEENNEFDGGYAFESNEDLNRDFEAMFSELGKIYDSNYKDYITLTGETHKEQFTGRQNMDKHDRQIVMKTMTYFSQNIHFSKYFKGIDPSKIESTKDFIKYKDLFIERFNSGPVQEQLKNMPAVRKYSKDEAKELFKNDEESILKSKENIVYRYVYDNICSTAEYDQEVIDKRAENDANGIENVDCDTNMHCTKEIPGQCELRTEEWETEIGYYFSIFDDTSGKSMDEIESIINIENKNVELGKDFEQLNKEIGKSEGKIDELDVTPKDKEKAFRVLVANELINYINDHNYEIEYLLYDYETGSVSREGFISKLVDVLKNNMSDMNESIKKYIINMLIEAKAVEKFSISKSMYDNNNIVANMNIIDFMANLYNIKYESIKGIYGDLKSLDGMSIEEASKMINSIEHAEDGKKTQSIKQVLHEIGIKVDANNDNALSELEFAEFSSKFKDPLLKLIKILTSDKEYNNIIDRKNSKNKDTMEKENKEHKELIDDPNLERERWGNVREFYSKHDVFVLGDPIETLKNIYPHKVKGDLVTFDFNFDRKNTHFNKLIYLDILSYEYENLNKSKSSIDTKIERFEKENNKKELDDDYVDRKRKIENKLSIIDKLDAKENRKEIASIRKELKVESKELSALRKNIKSIEKEIKNTYGSDKDDINERLKKFEIYHDGDTLSYRDFTNSIIDFDEIYKDELDSQDEHIHQILRDNNYVNSDISKDDYRYTYMQGFYDYLSLIYKEMIIYDQDSGIIVGILNKNNFKSKYFIDDDASYTDEETGDQKNIYLSDMMVVQNSITVGKKQADSFKEDEIIKYYLKVGKYNETDNNSEIVLSSGKLLVNHMIVIFYSYILGSIFDSYILGTKEADINIIETYISTVLKMYHISYNYTSGERGKFDKDKLNDLFNIKAPQIKEIVQNSIVQSTKIIYSEEVIRRMAYYQTKKYPKSKSEEVESEEE